MGHREPLTYFYYRLLVKFYVVFLLVRNTKKRSQLRFFGASALIRHCTVESYMRLESVHRPSSPRFVFFVPGRTGWGLLVLKPDG